MIGLPYDRDASSSLFLSRLLPCPYLPDAFERKVFMHLSGNREEDARTNSLLTQAGFRRSHDVVYRPACPACAACIPVRIPVKAFRPSPSLKRIAARNRALSFRDIGTAVTGEHYTLFKAYQEQRHPEGDMGRMTREEFVAMMTLGVTATSFYELRENRGEKHDRLCGGILVDRIDDGLSAITSFFLPEEPRRSLGLFLVLEIIREARRLGLPYVYLGYWIAESRKMAYKIRFRPLEAFGQQGWLPV